ncbi:MAG: hypothetical protein WBP85_01360, partial [Terracidiphilus sp.]
MKPQFSDCNSIVSRVLSGFSQALGAALGTVQLGWPSSVMLALGTVCFTSQPAAASNRSAYIPYDSAWTNESASPQIVLDGAHQQIFTAWVNLDRVDVLSTVDYHLIHSIAVPSPASVDISPDGSTLAVAASGQHVFFFSTTTFAKTNDVVIPALPGLGNFAEVTSFIYAANGNAIINIGLTNIATPGTAVVYWDAATNSVSLTPPNSSTNYSGASLLARSGDYTKILMADFTESAQYTSQV